MPWLHDQFTLRLTRMEGNFSLRLVCEACGASYNLRSGALHQLNLGMPEYQKIVYLEEHHICPAGGRTFEDPERMPY